MAPWIGVVESWNTAARGQALAALEENKIFYQTRGGETRASVGHGEGQSRDSRGKRVGVCNYISKSLCLFFTFLTFCMFLFEPCVEAKTHRIGVLLAGDIRREAVTGFKDGMKGLGYVEGEDVIFEVSNAAGNNAQLPVLADRMVAGKPDVAIACGGIEADALKLASKGSGLPVVFLAVSSSVDRGLVQSMTEPGGNMTGVDTNDTELTVKRIQYIKKLLPRAKRILILSIPSITSSAKAVELARRVGPQLGYEIMVLEAGNKEEMTKAVADISSDKVDVIYVGLAAPVWQIEKEVLFPISEAQTIPIMGVNGEDLARGAFASYASSRYSMGFQAARMVDKILQGTPPSKIPVETPENYEFLINKWVVERLQLELPGRAWKLANEIVTIPVD